MDAFHLSRESSLEPQILLLQSKADLFSDQVYVCDALVESGRAVSTSYTHFLAFQALVVIAGGVDLTR